MTFETQVDIWRFLVDGGTVYQDKTKIKFINGALKYQDGDEWLFCPISFENPKLFHYA